MEGSKQTHWIPLADLMTGLMMIFMLITAVYITYVEKTTTLVLDEFKNVKSNMQLALQNEFKESFKQWDAELLGDMKFLSILREVPQVTLKYVATTQSLYV